MMQKKASYTFLLPAYKAKYLDEMLKSIQGQTYTDFKVLISDDCSPEDIHSVCKPYLRDNRFKYRRNETNMGGENLITHWNILVDLCDTEYLIMASDDDVYAPMFLEEIDKLTKKYPYCDLFHARINNINARGEVFRDDTLYEECVNQLDYIQYSYYDNHLRSIANYVFRTQPLKNCGGFVNLPIAWGSDSTTCNMMAKNGCANTKDILFSFRTSGLNISSQPISDRATTRKKFEATCLSDEFMINLLKQVRYENTLKNRTTFERIMSQHKYNMSMQLMYYSGSLPLVDFARYVKKYREKGYIDSLFITWKKWIVAQIRRLAK